MINILKDFLLQLALIATLIFTFRIFWADKFNTSKHVKIIRSVVLGISILFCMSYPAYISNEFHMDLRIIPLLLGTLYGGWETGLFLAAMIILYRLFLGIDLGFYTTTLSLLFSMPVILSFQKYFLQANKNKRIQISLVLSIFYCLVGFLFTFFIRELFSKTIEFEAAIIYIMITVLFVLFFVSLNEMLKESLKKNQQLQLEAKDAEIAFLRSQIKPHFLYNALNSIAALCIDDPQKAEKLTLDLSEVLRSGFDFKQFETLTTIERELELIKAYLNIEKARFGTRLSVEYDVDDCLDIRIPPLVLQPLVENAVRHGLMPNLRGGTVKISIIKKVEDAVIKFIVEDNGCGMSQKTWEEIYKSDVKKRGVGLMNISQRIKLLYGKSIGIESAEGKGTKVFFEIPV